MSEEYETQKPARRRRILLTGASGGLGAALLRHLKPRHEVLGLCFRHPAEGLVALDLSEPGPIAKLARKFGPDLILHTVGLTDVDLCDRDLAKALDINTRSTLHVRLAAEALDCKVVHISTNDVFDGGLGMYRETDIPLPVNMYSETKLMAEKMFYNYPAALILRFTTLSWYASGKTTFASWLVNSLRQGRPVSLYTDQFNSPLYVATLAEWIEALFDAEGIYHLGSQRRSRWEAGMAIATALGLDTGLIRPSSLQDAAVLAPRPRDVSLDCSRVQADWGLETAFESEIRRLVADLPEQLPL